MAVVFAVQDSVHVREMRFGCELGRLRLHREKGCRQGRHVSDSGVMLPPTLRGDFSGVLRVPRILSRRGSTAVLRITIQMTTSQPKGHRFPHCITLG